MIGMVVVGAVAHNDVGFPLSYQAGERSAILDGRQQLSIMNIQDFSRDAKNLCGLLHLCLTTASQWAACFLPMADVSVGHGHELDVMSLSCPHDCHASGLEFAIIRMSAKANDSQLAVVCGRMSRR